MLNSVLRVNGFNERPIFIDNFNTVSINPKITTEEKVLKELFLQDRVSYLEPNFS